MNGRLERVSREAMAAAARGYYQEAFRRYHDWAHVEEIFAEADRLGLALTEAQELAITFHDAMNLVDPEHLGGTFNEGVSAHLMRAHARILGIPEPVVEDAAIIVLSTDHAPRSALTRQCAEVLDLDLLRLAAPYEAFLSHSHDVHFEWRHVIPDVGDFMAARAGYLYDRFLPRETIFQAGLFDEEAARTNIERLMSDFGRR